MSYGYRLKSGWLRAEKSGKEWPTNDASQMFADGGSTCPKICGQSFHKSRPYSCSFVSIRGSTYPLTIVIATCNRPDRLAHVLEYIHRADAVAGGGNKLIIADNGDETSAEIAVRQFSESSGMDVQYLRTPPRNKCKALNASIAVATTDWLAFTDDDTEPDENWLREGMRFAARGDCRYFGGRVVPGERPVEAPATLGPYIERKSCPGGGVYVHYIPLLESGLIKADSQAPLGSNCFACKDLFAERGGYDEELWDVCGKAALGCDDGEMGVRLKAAGEPIGFCKDAVVFHPVRLEQTGLNVRMRKTFWYGWQQTLVFFDPKQPVIEPWRVKLLAHAVGRTVRYLLNGNRAEMGSALVNMTAILGRMTARWSPAYRARRESSTDPLISATTCHEGN